MNNPWRRMLMGGLFFLGTCIFAILGYMMAGWSFLDAAYMVTITVFSVGYGETKPLDSTELKVFTMAVIILGCSSGIYVVGGFVSMLAEGDFNRALGNRRMSQGIERLVKHVIVCGYGRVGHVLAAELQAAGQEVLVIDSSEKRIAEAQQAGFLSIMGNASDESTLIAAGIERARVLTTVLPDDSANVFIALTARGLNSTLEIIARAEYPSSERKLLRAGADRVVLPAVLGAGKISHLITRPSADDLLGEAAGTAHLSDDLKRIGLEFNEVVIQPESPLVGLMIEDLEVTGGFVIVAIRQFDGRVVHKPGLKFGISENDTLIILGHSDTLPNLARRAKTKHKVTFRGATS